MVKRINLKQIANILLNKNIEKNEEKTKNKNWELMKPMTKNTKLKELTDSGLFYIPLSQHIGSPSIPIIEIGDSVKKYEKLERFQVIFQLIFTPQFLEILLILLNIL